MQTQVHTDGEFLIESNILSKLLFFFFFYLTVDKRLKPSVYDTLLSDNSCQGCLHPDPFPFIYESTAEDRNWNANEMERHDYCGVDWSGVCCGEMR